MEGSTKLDPGDLVALAADWQTRWDATDAGPAADLLDPRYDELAAEGFRIARQLRLAKRQGNTTETMTPEVLDAAYGGTVARLTGEDDD